jgi:hypothetical protein
MTTTKNQIENISINRTSSYGRYVIKGTVNGVGVAASTTNSEAFDWLNDDSNDEKHQDAIAYCESKLESAYEQM